MARRLTEQELDWLGQLRQEWLEEPLQKGQAHPLFTEWLEDRLLVFEAFEEYEECQLIHRFIQYLNANRNKNV